MKGYEKPIVLENIELFEAVYAESGYQEPPTGQVSATWSNHNSGSLSCISVNASVGNVPGNYIKVTVTFNGNVSSLGDTSGPYTSCDINGNTVVFIRDGSFNPNESFQFSINKAVCGDAGFDNHNTTEHKGSFFETGTNIGSSEGLSVSIEVA